MLYLHTLCPLLGTFACLYHTSVEAFNIKGNDEDKPKHTPLWRPTPYTPLIYNLFVYGKLKKGELNHYWMSNPENGLSKLIGSGETVKRYPMVIGKYKTPILVESPGKGHNILGEIYVVDTFMLRNLDMLEGVPVFNNRKIDVIRIFSEDHPKGKEMLCWMYFARVKSVSLAGMNYVSEYNSQNLPDSSK